jgi:hypothetical protein
LGSGCPPAAMFNSLDIQQHQCFQRGWNERSCASWGVEGVRVWWGHSHPVSSFLNDGLNAVNSKHQVALERMGKLLMLEITRCRKTGLFSMQQRDTDTGRTGNNQ